MGLLSACGLFPVPWFILKTTVGESERERGCPHFTVAEQEPREQRWLLKDTGVDGDSARNPLYLVAVALPSVELTHYG